MANKKIKIHFVCMGNIFRSRLAEAYANSLGYDNIEFSSSGLHAENYPINFLSSVTTAIVSRNKLDSYLKKNSTQTTNNILDDKDLIIFMRKNVLDSAKANYSFNINKSVHWNVRDLQDWKKKLSLRNKERITYDAIKRNVDNLLKNITRGGWVDVVDDKDVCQGYKLPIYLANKKKLWHRGSHVLLNTPDNKIVVEKRSPSIIFAANYLDISLGGHVDSGESPITTATRETKEELGLDIKKDDFNLIAKYKLNRYHPKYKTYSKQHVYAYKATLDTNNPNFILQRSEVSAVFLLNQKQIQKLLRLHSLKHLGRLNTTYKFYKTLLNSIDK